MEVEDDRWSLGGEEKSDLGEGRSRYEEHQRALVQACRNIDTEETYLRA